MRHARRPAARASSAAMPKRALGPMAGSTCRSGCRPQRTRATISRSWPITDLASVSVRRPVVVAATARALDAAAQLRKSGEIPGLSAISSIVVTGPIASSNTEALTTVARAAELTRDLGAGDGEDKLIEAKPLRPGKAARAVVSDGRAVRDAIEAVLAAPGESREVARRAYEAVRDQIVTDALDAMPVDRLRDLIRGKVTFAPAHRRGPRDGRQGPRGRSGSAQANPAGSPQDGQADHGRRMADAGVRRGRHPRSHRPGRSDSRADRAHRRAAPLRAHQVRAEGPGPEPAGERDRAPP